MVKRRKSKKKKCPRARDRVFNGMEFELYDILSSKRRAKLSAKRQREFGSGYYSRVIDLGDGCGYAVYVSKKSSGKY